MTEQMLLLRAMLDDAGIEWRDDSENGIGLPIDRTKFKYRTYEWSVIHGFGTYGGWNHWSVDEGLLELMSDVVNHGQPIGWLTASEVMEHVLGGGK